MANEADFLSTLGEDALLFRRMSGTEELGRLPEYHVELLRPSDDAEIQVADLLGTRASLRIELDTTGKYRWINGVVTQVVQGGTMGRFDIYRVELRPWLWQLTLGADSRIFQDKTVVEILDAVFDEYGATSHIEKSLKATYRSRPFTTQYRESDFNFVSRLMEEEGLYYYFKHQKDQHTLVLCDNPGAHQPIADRNLRWARNATAHTRQQDVIRQWNRSHSLRPLKFTHLDFAAEAPSTELKGESSRSTPYPKPNDLEVFDYPGGFDDIAMADGKTGAKIQEAARLAKLRVDAFESEHVVARGLTLYRSLAAGVTFTFLDHPQTGQYLVTQVAYELEFKGHEAQSDNDELPFTCRFEAVPQAINFQPQPSARRPFVQGPQTATVVGPAGNKIYTDKHGRVKVQFRWDRVGKKNETSSCWVRVSHPWASKQFGMIALPRVGDEVVVEFLEGNPDRPIVTGRVYNGDNMPPYKLPDHPTLSGMKGAAAATSNELRFEDLDGSEYVWLQAQKDFHQMVNNDAYESVKRHLWTDVAKNAQHSVGENLTLGVGKVATVAVTGDTHVKLGADLNGAVTGALNLKVTGAVAAQGEQAVALTSGAAMDVNAGAGMSLTATSMLSAKGLTVVLEGSTQLSLKVGGSFITLDASGVTIQGPIVKINSGGASGSGKDAAKASPTAPKEPGAATANTDPLGS